MSWRWRTGGVRLPVKGQAVLPLVDVALLYIPETTAVYIYFCGVLAFSTIWYLLY